VQLPGGRTEVRRAGDVVSPEDAVGLVAGHLHRHALWDAAANEVANGGASQIVNRARAVGGELRVNHENSEVRVFPPDMLPELKWTSQRRAIAAWQARRAGRLWIPGRSLGFSGIVEPEETRKIAAICSRGVGTNVGPIPARIPGKTGE
jgi:hypothetical protein